MVEPGAVLCGKYRIEQLLGKGGMGIIARARHLDLDQPVALKLLLPEVLRNQNVVKRFRREAQAMVQLKGEHVCRVFDVGMLDDGAPFMVMEYLEGKDLGQILQGQGRLALGFAVDLVLQACEALAEAHALGIVHRDVKPANCFLTRGPDGEPLLKVLDFGISKALGVEDGAITTSQMLIGSPSYMSPEQMHSSKDVDERTDIWSLGVVLYELVSGWRPFLGDNFAALCLAVTTKPMLPLDDLVLPDGLLEVIACCLEKRPEDRFGSMAELSAALAPYAGTREQGDRSTARTARIIGRASSPSIDLVGISASISAMVSHGPPATLGETIVGAGAARKRARELVGTLPTLTDGPTETIPPESSQREVRRAEGTTERTTRPLRVMSRPRPRRRWLVATAGLALVASIWVLRVMKETDDGPEATTGPESERPGRPDVDVQRAPVIGARPSPADVRDAGVQAENEIENEPKNEIDDRSPAPEPDSEPKKEIAGGDPAVAPASAAKSAGSDVARRPRRRADRGESERSGAGGRPTDASRPPPAATTVQPLIDDAAFGSRE